MRKAQRITVWCRERVFVIEIDQGGYLVKSRSQLCKGLVMVFCFLFVLVPAALAQAMPTKDEEHIFANGIPVVFKEGEDGKTNMYLASDTEFVSPVFTDVSDYIIYAGWPDGDREGDTSLTF